MIDELVAEEIEEPYLEDTELASEMVLEQETTTIDTNTKAVEVVSDEQ